MPANAGRLKDLKQFVTIFKEEISQLKTTNAWYDFIRVVAIPWLEYEGREMCRIKQVLENTYNRLFTNSK